MKFFIVFIAIFALTLAIPVDHNEGHQHHQILKLESDIGSKDFKYAYETSNGIHNEEEGHLKDVGHGHGDYRDHGRNHGHNRGHDPKDHEAIVVHGSYAWVDEKTGAKFNIQYVADENGYQPAPIKLPHH